MTVEGTAGNTDGMMGVALRRPAARKSESCAPFSLQEQVPVAALPLRFLVLPHQLRLHGSPLLGICAKEEPPCECVKDPLHSFTKILSWRIPHSGGGCLPPGGANPCLPCPWVLATLFPPP